jgi:NitT/TauT family transport system permease protein
MIQAQTSLDTGAMFMAIVLLTLVGVGVYLITIGLERLCVVKDTQTAVVVTPFWSAHDAP